MKYLSEYRRPQLVRKVLRKLKSRAHKLPTGALKFMEVCGTHTMSAARFGLRRLLPENIRLISGPGCPVCVTPAGYIDAAIKLAQSPEVVIATFGDMVRVPGSDSSLEQAQAEGANLQVIYSPLDALSLAQAKPEKKIVFLAVGFETTVPNVAATVLAAGKSGIRNFFALVAHKLIPPAMCALLEAPYVHIDGFLCPGHVSVIIGPEAYQTIASTFHTPCVVAGFEPFDILQAICMLVEQKLKGEHKIDVEYRRAVRAGGNPRARAIMKEVFQPVDADWRGLGRIPTSGLKLKPALCRFDAEAHFGIRIEAGKDHPECRCGDVLRGTIEPPECKLFGKACTPRGPLGACMVSSEGTCAAYFKYGNSKA